MPARHVTRTTWGVIDAREVRFPVVARDSRLLFTEFAAPADAVRALVPLRGLELVETAPGRASVTVVLADHRASDLGPFHAASLTTIVAPSGSDAEDEAGHLVCTGATADAFQNEIMYWALGMPHDSDDVGSSDDGDDVTFRVACAEGESLSARIRRPPATTPQVTAMSRSYGYIDDDVYVIPLALTAAPAAVDPASMHLTLGTGHLADVLRSVGFPATSPDWWWAEGCQLTSSLPRRLPST
jgi:hypothetical protein